MRPSSWSPYQQAVVTGEPSARTVPTTASCGPRRKASSSGGSGAAGKALRPGERDELLERLGYAPDRPRPGREVADVARGHRDRLTCVREVDLDGALEHEEDLVHREHVVQDSRFAA